MVKLKKKTTIIRISHGTTPLKNIPYVTQTSLLVGKGSMFGPLSRTPSQHPVRGPFDLVGYSWWLQKGPHNSSRSLKCRSSLDVYLFITSKHVIYMHLSFVKCNFYKIKIFSTFILHLFWSDIFIIIWHIYICIIITSKHFGIFKIYYDGRSVRVESVSSSVNIAIIWINKCLELYIVLVNSKKNKSMGWK